MFQLFTYQQLEFEYLKLMWKKSQAAQALWGMFREMGALSTLIKDSDKEMDSDKWLRAVCTLAIEEHTSEAYH